MSVKNDNRRIQLTIWLSFISGLLYRAGGYGPPFNTKFRDLGVPSIMLIYFWTTGHWDSSLWLCFLLMFGAQTSYFKEKGSNAQWINWFWVGMAFSVAMLPYSIHTGQWPGFFWRSLAIIPFTILWSEFIGWDDLEEFGRGAIQIVTLPILVLFT